MGFDQGRIELDSNNKVYYSGQTVRGRLIFDQTKVKTFRGIYVKVKGHCKVHWTTQHSRRHDGKTQHYTVVHESHEEYLHWKTYLIGGEQGEVTIQPGHYEFTFECPLPHGCPSSFEGSHGHIRYELKAVVDRSLKFDQEKELSLRIIAPLDLNLDPISRIPIHFEFPKTYHCCCVKSGSSVTTVAVPVSGFCPGQVIPVELNCKNDSNNDIRIKLAVKKEITFHATHEPGTKTERGTVAEIKKGPVPGHTSRNWSLSIQVPAIDVYNVNACRYIDIDYEFKVTVNPEGCHSSSHSSRRIVLGTRPLAGFQDDVPNPLQDQMPRDPVPVSPSYQTSGYPHPSNQAPVGNPPYPGGASYPYPGNDNPPPYPGITPYPTSAPYPGSMPLPEKSPPATIGFAVGGGAPSPAPGFGIGMPALPPGAAMPYPPSSAAPYPGAAPSAPEPPAPYGYNVPAYNPDAAVNVSEKK